MYSFRSKSTLHIPKSVFNAFRRKLSLGAPAGSHVGYDLSIRRVSRNYDGDQFSEIIAMKCLRREMRKCKFCCTTLNSANWKRDWFWYTNRQIYPTIYLKFEFFINSPYKVIITTTTATDKNSKNIIVQWEDCFTVKWLQKIKMNSVYHLNTERGIVIRRLFHWHISLIIK